MRNGCAHSLAIPSGHAHPIRRVESWEFSQIRSSTLTRRYVHRDSDKKLKGFALDITLRFNSDGHAFLDDKNGDGLMPFGTVDEVADFVAAEIRKNHEEHFGA